MSQVTANRVANDLNNQPAYIRPLISQNAEGVSFDGSRSLEAIRLLAAADPDKEIAAESRRHLELSSAYGFGVPSLAVEKPYLFINGAAFIPIHGMLINRFPYSWSWVTGYNYIRDMISAASTDDDVKLIVYDVNTYGGLVPGCQETADAMFAARALKPSIAVIDAACYSAGYYLASQADKVVVTPSGGVGSIGVLCLRWDYSASMAQCGVAVTAIHAGKFKTDGLPFAAMSADEGARIQASVDQAYDGFVAAVVRGRAMTDEAVRATEAGCYTATDALRIGLVDAIVAPAAAVQDALCPPDDDNAEGDPDDDSTEEDTMTTKPIDAAAGAAPVITADQLAAAGVTAQQAERARITGILSCEEATGKGALAKHLATETEMSVEAAKAMLKVATPERTAETNPLESAMDRNGTPGVGASGGGAPAAGTTEEKVARILEAQASATGRKLSVAA